MEGLRGGEMRFLKNEQKSFSQLERPRLRTRDVTYHSPSLMFPSAFPCMTFAIFPIPKFLSLKL